MLIVLVTSPRVAPGLLTLEAWDALRDAARVLCGTPDHPQLPALSDAGIACGDHRGGRRVRACGLAQALATAVAQTGGPVVWLAGGPARAGLGSGIGDGTGELLAALDQLGPAAPATAVLRGSADLPGARLLDLAAAMAILRAECPWDAKQTHESLAPSLLEEPYEALEALENGDQRALREELGDVLIQVVFHAEIASERDDATGYSIDDVADGIVAKLVRRHPHVFADVAVSGADEVTQNWDAIKKAERAGKAAPGDSPASALDGVPFGQPALALAAQLQRRAARADIPAGLAETPRGLGRRGSRGGRAPGAGGAPGAPAAVQASGVTRAVQASRTAHSTADPGTALGDHLFGLVAAAAAEGLDPETELRAAARRYAARVRAWEQAHPRR